MWSQVVGLSPKSVVLSSRSWGHSIKGRRDKKMYHSEAIKIRTSSFQRALVKDLYLVYPRMLKTGSGELLPLQQFPPEWLLLPFHVSLWIHPGGGILSGHCGCMAICSLLVTKLLGSFSLLKLLFFQGEKNLKMSWRFRQEQAGQSF